MLLHLKIDDTSPLVKSIITIYLYHRVITRFVKFPLWSLENERARPKSASFKLPSLSISKLDPATHTQLLAPGKYDPKNNFKILILTFYVTMEYLIYMTIMQSSQQLPHVALVKGLTKRC